MRNRYPGPCHKCGNTVAVNKGQLLNSQNGYQIYHGSCAPQKKKKEPKPYWKFEALDWCSSYYQIFNKELTMDILWPYLKSEEVNGKKHNYRLVKVDDACYQLESNLDCGRPCDWRKDQMIHWKEAANA